jgi:hypothetical protein
MIIGSKVTGGKFFNKLEKQIFKLGSPNQTIVLTEYPEKYDPGRFNVKPLVEITDEFLSANPLINFIYAIEHSSVGLDIVRRLIKNNSVWYSAMCAEVGGYMFDNKSVKDLLEAEAEKQDKAGFSKFGDPGSAGDYANLCQAINATKYIEGDIVEIGVYRGSSSCIILGFVKSIDTHKKLWFFDTFEGFNYEEARNSVDRVWKDTHQTEGYDKISKRIKSRAPDRKDINIQKLNIISDPLPPEIKKISVCNIDVDMLEAVNSAFEKIAPLMSVGGIMICEDAGHTPALIGARLALDDFLQSSWCTKFIPIFMESGQVFLIRHSL